MCMVKKEINTNYNRVYSQVMIFALKEGKQ